MNRIATPVRPPETWSEKSVSVTSWSPAVLYRQPGILVTVEVFRVGRRSYPVADLYGLRTARGGHHPTTVRAVGLAGVVLAAAGVGLSFSHHPADLSPATYLALLVAAFVPIVAAVVGSRLRPRPYELWGEYHGATVPLFVSDDERVYGQVTRALRRAREAQTAAQMSAPWRPPVR